MRIDEKNVGRESILVGAGSRNVTEHLSALCKILGLLPGTGKHIFKLDIKKNYLLSQIT